MPKFKYMYAGREPPKETQIKYHGRVNRTRTESFYRQEIYGKKHLWELQNIEVYSEKSRVRKGFVGKDVTVRAMTYTELEKEGKGWVIHKEGQTQLVRAKDVEHALKSLEKATGEVYPETAINPNLLDQVFKNLDAGTQAEVVSRIAEGIDGYDWKDIFTIVYPGGKHLETEETDAEYFRDRVFEIIQEVKNERAERMKKASRFKQ